MSLTKKYRPEMADYLPGRRIRIHPSCDWFMRGVVYATIVGTKGERIRVEHELSPIQHHDGSVSKRRIWLWPEDILEVIGRTR